jgi:hypothetical protein
MGVIILVGGGLRIHGCDDSGRRMHGCNDSGRMKIEDARVRRFWSDED